MRLYLIRHGKTEANKKRLYCGQTDIGLCNEGRNELISLKEKVSYPKTDIFVVSGLKRTKETLEILYSHASPICMPVLNEFNFGDFEMKSYEELKERYDYQTWIQNIEITPCPMGESKLEFKHRIKTGINQLEELLTNEQDKSAAVITHGGVIAQIMDFYFPNQKNFYEWQPDFGRGYFVDLNKLKQYTII